MQELAAVPFADVAVVSDVVAGLSQGVASILPAPLSTIVSTVGMDAANALSLRFTLESVGRLTVCSLCASCVLVIK